MNSVQSLLFLLEAKSVVLSPYRWEAEEPTGRKKEYCYIAVREIITLYSTVAELNFRQAGQVAI